MTPEQIVEMIGNVANRADIKAIQASQVMLIKALVREARAEGMREAEAICEHQAIVSDNHKDKVGAYTARTIRGYIQSKRHDGEINEAK